MDLDGSDKASSNVSLVIIDGCAKNWAILSLF